jgi:hypothetical protein
MASGQAEGFMPADLDLITATWHVLRPFSIEEKCATCECLQGALVELQMAIEDLPATADPGELPNLIQTALSNGEPHACQGCQPCNPGDILANFYRERQRREAAAACGCGDG